MTQKNNGQNNSDLVQTSNLLGQARPELPAVRLDEIKRDVLRRQAHPRMASSMNSLRRRVLALTLFVMLFAISTSNAAATVANLFSGGSFDKNLGQTGDKSGTKYFWNSYHFGGDSTDDAGHETYCPDDKGSDDGDGSSSDNSDKDTKSDDGDKSSGDQSDDHKSYSSGSYSTSTSKGGDYGGGGGDVCESDKSTDHSSDRSEKSDDGDKSSGDHSDEKSDDGDKSSGDNSDKDDKSDDRDASSDDKSDEKSDDWDASSDDYSDRDW